MSKGNWAFRPKNITRAVKAVRDAGLTVSGVRISPQGEIDIETGGPTPHDSAKDLERWLAKRGRDQCESV